MEKYNINSALIQVDGNKIKHVKLRIFIDEHISWTTHIDNLSKQVARNVGMLNKLKLFSLCIY